MELTREQIEEVRRNLPNSFAEVMTLLDMALASLSAKERGVQAAPAAPVAGIPYEMDVKFDHETRVVRGVIPDPPVAERAEPLSTNYIQTVPDKCDRIVWRTHYYHLPIKSEAEVERIGIRKGLEMALTKCYASMSRTEACAHIEALLDAQKEGVPSVQSSGHPSPEAALADELEGFTKEGRTVIVSAEWALTVVAALRQRAQEKP